MQNICVFCSANDVSLEYIKATQKFGRLLGEKGYDLVWGGSNTGLMKVIADSAEAAGCKLFGVSVELLRHKQRPNADEMFTAKDLGERKSVMLAKADAFVVMVGGIGTFDEITEILELKKHHLHHKPIVFLNINNFFEGLKIQLQKMEDEGFIKQKLEELVYFANTPEEAIEYLNTYA